MEVHELFDGELHEITPADWEQVSQKVVEWVEVEGQPKHLEIETPELNWVISDLNESEARTAGVEGGWSRIAVSLQELSRKLGGRPVCYQKGKRYFFQHKSKED
jgi:hypothetical protein